MKSKLTNYSKSVWTGKSSQNEYYGLRSAAASLGQMPGDEAKSTTSALGKSKKGSSAKEAQRIQANGKIIPQVVATIEKGKIYGKRIKEEEEQRAQEEELIRVQNEEKFRDANFCKTQQSEAMNYTERNLVNPNLLDKQEELRRIKSELEDEKLKMQKNNSEVIAELERKKGVAFKSKSSNPQFLPIKEDIIVDKKEARDLIFDAGSIFDR